MTEPGGVATGTTRSREFEADGAVWLARVTGRCLVGAFPGVAIESVHLQRRDEPASGEWLVYLPRAAFEILRDDDLRDLLRSASPLTPRPSRAVDPVP